MKVVVVGGGGPLDAEVVDSARAHGLGVDLIAAEDPSTPRTVGELSALLMGCAVVIDLSGPPSLKDGTMTEEYGLVIDDEASVERAGRSTVRLLAAEFTAGVQHHVALSAVGVDRLRDRGYFRALHAQETMIRQSGMPYSIIRATELFEHVFDLAEAGTEDWIVWVTPVQVQPVAGREVATLLAHTAASKPVLGIREIAGPDQLRLDTFVHAALTSAADEPRRVFTDSRSLYFGASLRHSDLLPGEEAYIAQMHYSDWLKGEPVPISPERPHREEMLDQR